jgi:hypothetical protein
MEYCYLYLNQVNRKAKEETSTYSFRFDKISHFEQNLGQIWEYQLDE